jgi:hypothetical protein
MKSLQKSQPGSSVRPLLPGQPWVPSGNYDSLYASPGITTQPGEVEFKPIQNPTPPTAVPGPLIPSTELRLSAPVLRAPATDSLPAAPGTTVFGRWRPHVKKEPDQSHLEDPPTNGGDR